MTKNSLYILVGVFILLTTTISAVWWDSLIRKMYAPPQQSDISQMPVGQSFDQSSSQLSGQSGNQSIVSQPANQTLIPTEPAAKMSVSSSVKTVNQSGAVQFVKKTSGRCEALAPEDWAIVSDQDTGMSAGLGSPDQTIFASWLVPWTVYSAFPQDRDETYFLQVALCINNMSDRYGSGWLVPCRENYTNVHLSAQVQTLINGYKMREFFTTNNALKKDLKGAVIYKDFSSGDIGIYLLRIASTIPSLWEQKGGIALSSAISIRCTLTLGSGTSYQTTRQKSDSDIDLSEKWQEATMGYENVYSPTTGEHYTAPLNSYWAGGPQGAGYYRSVPGGGYEKLTPGYGSY